MRSKEKVAVAMSGGVDSSVAAYLLKKAGYEVSGIHLRMEKDVPDDPELYKCCEQLGIELTEVDCADNFYRNVLYASACEYACGRTPNPCCVCNMTVKFAELFRAADKLGIEKVFTGHYVRLLEKDGLFLLSKGADAGKDQSYFLYRLTQKELRRTGFPLGDLSKDEVRKIAAEAQLSCAVRKDSQDACFQISGECCGETLRRRCDLPEKRGKFIYQGKTVGYHNGIHRYTLGQRQGLNVALGKPAYIKSIEPQNGNIILVTDQDELLASEFTVKNVSWQSGRCPGKKLTVKVRYRSPGTSCEIRELSGDSISVVPENMLRAVTPGQAAVFYDGDLLVGGGEIDYV